MLHSTVFIDLWALDLIMPDFQWICPSWLIDCGVQIGVHFLEAFFSAHQVVTEFLSQMGSLISSKRWAHDSYSSTWEARSWLSLVYLNVAGFSWNLWKQNYLWHLYHQSNLAQKLLWALERVRENKLCCFRTLELSCVFLCSATGQRSFSDHCWSWRQQY